MNGENGRDKALDALTEQESFIFSHINKLKADLDAIRRAKDILSNHKKQLSLLETEAGVGEFADLTPTEAVLRILEDRPEKDWKPTELANELKRRGVRTTSKFFTNIISATLNRLYRLDKIQRINTERGSAYKKKAEGSPNGQGN